MKELKEIEKLLEKAMINPMITAKSNLKNIDDGEVKIYLSDIIDRIEKKETIDVNSIMENLNKLVIKNK